MNVQLFQTLLNPKTRICTPEAEPSQKGEELADEPLVALNPRKRIPFALIEKEVRGFLFVLAFLVPPVVPPLAYHPPTAHRESSLGGFLLLVMQP